MPELIPVAVFVPVAVIAFVLGYGVRAIISRRRHKKSRQHRSVRLDPMELSLLRTYPRPSKRRNKIAKDAKKTKDANPEAPEGSNDPKDASEA